MGAPNIKFLIVKAIRKKMIKVVKSKEKEELKAKTNYWWATVKPAISFDALIETTSALPTVKLMRSSNTYVLLESQHATYMDCSIPINYELNTMVANV